MLIDRAYRWLSVPFTLVAGPYYALQLVAAAAPYTLTVIGFLSFDNSLFSRRGIFIQLAAILGGGVLVAILRKRQYDRAVRTTANPNVEILTEATTYSINNDNQYYWDKAVTIRPLITGLTQFVLRFRWTGVGDAAVVESNGGRVTLEPLSSTADDSVVFHFTPPLRKGVKHDIRVRVAFKNPTRSVRPFLASTINHPIIDQFVQRVCFENDQIPKFCKKRIYESAAASTPYHELNEPVTEANKQIEWIIKRPRHRHRYAIEWDAGGVPQ